MADANEWTHALVDERFSAYRHAAVFTRPGAPEVYEPLQAQLAALAHALVEELAPGRHRAEALRWLENAQQQLGLALTVDGMRAKAVPSAEGGGGGGGGDSTGGDAAAGGGTAPPRSE